MHQLEVVKHVLNHMILSPTTPSVIQSHHHQSL